MSYYDRDGRPVDDETADRLLGDPEYRILAQTTVGGYLVSTVWLGFDHSLGRGARAPVIFETMVFDQAGDEAEQPRVHVLDCRRYCTEVEARAGHEEMVTLVRATTGPTS